MKNFLRVVSIILTISILCTVLASCGFNQPQANNDGTIYADWGEKITDLPDSEENEEKTYTASEVESLVMSLDFGPDVEIESVSARYVSPEYLAELQYNSLELYIWEVAASAFNDLQGEAWFLTLEDGIATPGVMNRAKLIAQHEAMMKPNTSNNNIMKNFLIGAGVMLVCIGVSIAGTPAVACVALSALKGAVVGSIVGAAVYAGIGAVTYRVSEGTWKIPPEAMLDYAMTGFRDGAIFGAITGALNPSICFPEDVTVLTASGTVAIQDVQVGDMVWSYNEATGETSLCRVTHTLTNTTNELVELTLQNGEAIECTPSHPFFEQTSKKWIRATDLKPHDILVNVNGESVILESIEHRLLEEPIDVYNLTVDTGHTFFVSGGEESALVHNSCAHQTSAWRTEKATYWKNQGALYQNSVNANTLSSSGTYTLSQSNVSRMLAGKAPIGLDGKAVNLHHLSGISTDLYSYTEVTATQHFANYKSLHPWLFK